MPTKVMEQLNFLSKVSTAPYWITNLYLDLSGPRRVGKAYITAFKRLATEQREYINRMNLPEEVLQSMREDLERIREFLEKDPLKGYRAAAIFCSSSADLFEVVKLPYVYKDQLSISITPSIRQIIAIDEEIGKVGVLAFDKKHIRLFIVTYDKIEEVTDFINEDVARTSKFYSSDLRVAIPARGQGYKFSMHGVGEYTFHMRLREAFRRTLKIAADATFEYYKLNPFDKLIIATFEEYKGHIEDFLHPYLLRRLVGYIEANPGTIQPYELADKVYQLLWDLDRKEEEEILQSLQEKNPKGLSVFGLEAVIKMLSIGNVRRLVVAQDYRHPGWIAIPSRTIILDPSKREEYFIGKEEKLYELFDIVPEVIEETLAQRGEIEVIVKPELQKSFEGIAAELRFSLTKPIPEW